MGAVSLLDLQDWGKNLKAIELTSCFEHHVRGFFFLLFNWGACSKINALLLISYFLVCDAL